ncbi:cupredoxin domain-containing protein [Patescibacteria group bacterium]|nr:cupredoxin domain-containing protein [Patescibacteria group bacterium]
MNKIVTSIVVIVLIIIGAFFFFGGNGKTTETETPSSSQPVAIVIDEGQTVIIQGHQLLQDDLEIEVGTTIIWRNKDSFIGLPYDKHTITSGSIDLTGAKGVKGVVPNSGSGVSDGIFQKGLELDEVFDYTFTEPGIYTFYIAEHPGVSGEGRIVVREKDQTDNAGVVTMIAKSFSFTPDIIQARAGEQVSIDITATGQHTFTVDELEVDVVLPHGETTRVEFIPDKPGTYEFYCRIPGHRQAGQVGTLTIE